MEPERRKQISLVVLGLILAFLAYRGWSRTSDQASSSSRTDTAASAAGRSPGAPDTAPAVHLRELDEHSARPVEGRRDLFRFRPKPPPPAPRPASLVPDGSSGPAQPPAPPPITLKFIGVIERPERSEKIAVLRDPTGHLWSGPEGAVIEGRFRILRIGAESIEMAYLDGRGRQTIRMSGV
jgi:hypothetical protein